MLPNAHISALVALTGAVLFLVSCPGWSASPDETHSIPSDNSGQAEETTKTLYLQWVARYENGPIFQRPDENDPQFVKLLACKDVDILFLQGLHAGPDPVRRLSRLALGRLKTDRSFEALAQQCHDANQFVRERAVQALAGFRQPRCVPVLLDVLTGDTVAQVRCRAADELEAFPEERVKAALLEALKNDPPVARHAAYALGGMQATEAIEPTYQLVLDTKNVQLRVMALWGLRRHRRKEAVELLMDLRDKLSRTSKAEELLIMGIDADLRGYALQTRDVTGPVPETSEQWKEWWVLAQPLFTIDMKRKKVPPPPSAAPEELGSDASDLEFRVSLDAKAYRVADPIAVDFSMRNRSSSPLRTIPPVTSGWWPTMAYGIHLERLGKTPETLLASEPSDFYEGSYSGPPSFETIPAGETFSRRGCLHHWIEWQKRDLWPLPEGSYRLTITFDNAQFAGASAGKGELLHRWQAPPVEFTVSGAPRTDPEELLSLVAEKSRIRWFTTDLDSRNADRSRPAWYAIHVWGDDRLAPALRSHTHAPYDFGPLPHYVTVPPTEAVR